MKKFLLSLFLLSIFVSGFLYAQSGSSGSLDHYYLGELIKGLHQANTQVDMYLAMAYGTGIAKYDETIASFIGDFKRIEAEFNNQWILRDVYPAENAVLVSRFTNAMKKYILAKGSSWTKDEIEMYQALLSIYEAVDFGFTEAAKKGSGK